MKHVVIMAGGSGTRFWPYSRSLVPKQCLSLVGEKTMIEETADRFNAFTESVYISTGEELAKVIAKTMPLSKFVVEPMGRDTAACIGLSAIQILKDDPEAILIFEAADHHIGNRDLFLKHVSAAIKKAEEGFIATIGIRPNRSATEYGYINAFDLDENIDGVDVLNVHQFVEKPDLKTAKEFVQSGKYLWNSGMFVTKASVILEELGKYHPVLMEGLQKIKDSDFDPQTIYDVFDPLEKISIDYAVIEKTDKLKCIAGTFDWDDVGDWKAMERIFEKDEKGNIVRGEYSGDAKDCIIFSQGRKIELGDVSDLIIVDTPDALLVCDRGKSQKVKKMVDMIKEADLEPYTREYVQEVANNIISLESGECEINALGLVGLINVNNLIIEKDDQIVKIK